MRAAELEFIAAALDWHKLLADTSVPSDPHGTLMEMYAVYEEMRRTLSVLAAKRGG